MSTGWNPVGDSIGTPNRASTGSVIGVPIRQPALKDFAGPIESPNRALTGSESGLRSEFPVKGFCRPDWESQSGLNWAPN